MKTFAITLIMLIYSDVAFTDVDANFFKFETKRLYSVEGPPVQVLPQNVMQLLEKHPVWQTSAGYAIPGQGPILTSFRKWKVEKKGNSIFLKELTQLKTVLNCSTQQALKWDAATIDLSATFDARQFLIGNPSDCQAKKDDQYNVKILTEDRFAVISQTTGLEFAVLFFPSIHLQRKPTPPIAMAVHIFTAPGGGIASSAGLNVDRTAYLHHDLRTTMPVFLDVSFPDKYIATLEKSLANWNAALGRDFFVIKKNKSILDPLDCSSSRKLCLFWSGSDEVSFLGATAITLMTFDPEDGKIFGGYIGVNSDGSNHLVTAPSSEELDHFVHEDTNLENVAKLFLKRAEFLHYIHPNPEWQVGYALSHEIGHFNGLSHNFYGSRYATSANATGSVMEYSAFSAINSKSCKIGPLDREAIRLIYDHRRPSIYYASCGDKDSEDPEMSSVSKDPNCNKFDFGSPDRWFAELARFSAKGVFEAHPRFNGILLDYLSAFLIPSSSVTRNQSKNVNQFLCGQGKDVPAIDNYVAAHLKVHLSCEEYIR